MAQSLSSIFSLMALHLSSEFIPLMFQFKMFQFLLEPLLLLLGLISISNVLKLPPGTLTKPSQRKSKTSTQTVALQWVQNPNSKPNQHHKQQKGSKDVHRETGFFFTTSLNQTKSEDNNREDSTSQGILTIKPIQRSITVGCCRAIPDKIKVDKQTIH